MADVPGQTVSPATDVEVDTKEHGQCALKQVEHIDLSRQPTDDFDQDEVEPELHARTYVALAAFFLLNYVQVVALQGPSSVVSVRVPLPLTCGASR